MTLRQDRCAGTPGKPCAGAFTMVELLVVLVVLAILATIALGLASRVTESGKRSLTENTIRGMEQVLTELKADLGARPPSWVTTDRTMVRTVLTPSLTDAEREEYDTRRFHFPIIDGRYSGDSSADPAQASSALFLLLAAERSGGVEAILKGIDSKVVERRDVWAYGWEIDNNGNPTGSAVQRRLRVPVVMDGFGQPIRFVHPSFDGGAGDYWDGSSLAARPLIQADPDGSAAPASFSRSYRPFNPASASSDAVGDADEGICPGKNPYFYSAGNDQDPGTRDDNVYGGVEPRFPDDTMDLK